MSTFRTFAVALFATLGIWAAIAFGLGISGLILVVTLTILEITFSFDNAIVNSKLLQQMSKFWQQIFMTFGILIAVFVVRFALPILIVDLTAKLGFGQVVSLAFHNPHLYAADLDKATPYISAFGGAFLLMIAVNFFLDDEKDVHWFGWLESKLAPFGKYDNMGILAILALALVVPLTMTAPVAEKFGVMVAALAGIALHMALDVFGEVADSDDEDEDGVPTGPTKQVKVLVGGAAVLMFIRLEVLDASFSFDGVIGAFAITTSVIIIMAGLGCGALWVRSLTVHLVRTGTLAKYIFLEHGAHWAILALGVYMVSKLYGANLPDTLTGSIGLFFVALALLSSIVHNKREMTEVKREGVLAS